MGVAINNIPKPYCRIILQTSGLVGSVSSTYANNRVYLSQVEVPVNCICKSIYVPNVVTIAGNIRVGIYPESSTPNSPAGSTLLVESASTAQAGASGAQEITLTDTTLVAGTYFLAFCTDDATATVQRTAAVALIKGQSMYFDQVYGNLPTTCPAITNSTTINPAITLKVLS